MTTTPTSGAADLPEALINIAREIEALKRDCGMDPESAIAIQNGRYMAISSEIRALAAGQATAAQAVVPAGWNLVPTEPTQAMLDAVATSMDDFLLGKEAEKQYREDWAAMLAAAPAQPAAQQGAAYAATPTSNYAGRVYEEGFLIGTCPLYTADQLRAFADATHALRASHGQAPAGAGEAAEHYRNAIARARLLDSDLSNLTERGAKAWAGVDAQGLRDGGASPSANAGEPSAHIKEPYTLAEIKAKIDSNDYSAEMLLQHAMLLLDSVQEDAARYRCLRRWKGQEHEPPFTVQHEIDGTLWGGDLDAAIDTARKQGANHD